MSLYMDPHLGEVSPDFEFVCYLSLWVCYPRTEAAEEHLLANVSDEAQFWAGGVVVEPRYVPDMAAAIRAEGYVVGGDA
jgi:hypothetical protein